MSDRRRLSSDIDDCHKEIWRLDAELGRAARRVMKAETLRQEHADLRQIVVSQRLELNRLNRALRYEDRCIKRLQEKLRALKQSFETEKGASDV